MNVGLGIFEAREAEEEAKVGVEAAAGVEQEAEAEQEGEAEEQEEYDEAQYDESYQAWSQMPYSAAMCMPWMASADAGAMPFWAMAGSSSMTGASAGSIRYRGSLKQRFCATFPSVNRCRHGAACAFAHSREEVSAPLLTPQEESYVPGALTEEFFTERFKVYWCPIGGQHDWHSCMYAHTYQDVRRPPSIGYGHQLCPYWNKKDTSLPYSQRCPLGPRCPYAHGAKEQLYHPGYFRTLVCRDLQRKRCPRGQLCAFFHKQTDERASGADDNVDYKTPLSKDDFPDGWYAYFTNPPRFQDVCDGMGAEGQLAGFGSSTPKGEDMETPRTRAHSGDSLDVLEAPGGKGTTDRGGKRGGASRGGKGSQHHNAAYWGGMGAYGGMGMDWQSMQQMSYHDGSYAAYAGSYPRW